MRFFKNDVSFLRNEINYTFYHFHLTAARQNAHCDNSKFHPRGLGDVFFGGLRLRSDFLRAPRCRWPLPMAMCRYVWRGYRSGKVGVARWFSARYLEDESLPLERFTAEESGPVGPAWAPSSRVQWHPKVFLGLVTYSLGRICVGLIYEIWCNRKLIFKIRIFTILNHDLPGLIC